MISLRVRKFGSQDWTTLRVEGEFEDSIVQEIIPLLSEVEDSHIQVWVEDLLTWEDME